MIDYEVAGLRELEARLAKFPDVTKTAASLAINRAAKKGRTDGSSEIRQQVNLNRPYVDEKLTVSRWASPESLWGTISGRRRATSLYRFAARRLTRKSKRGHTVNAGVSVKVKRSGGRVKMKRAFVFPYLKGGVDGYNTGVVVRTDGSPPSDAYKPLKLFKNDSTLWLLYGPSVDQVFNETRDIIAPTVEDVMQSEFDRQFKRLF